jgi:hypothetical protein
MKLGIMQPYIFPYLGYFQLIQAVDKFVIYDDVSFIKQGWINRNQLLVNKQKYIFQIPVHHISSYKSIKQTLVADKPHNWEKKLLRTIEQAYSKAPHFDQVYYLVKDVISEKQNSSIADLACNSIKAVLRYLNLERVIVESSEVYNNSELRSEVRVIDICKKEGAAIYINAIGGQELYRKSNFDQHGISLYFIEPKLSEYQQLNNEFIPGLSIIDIMMYCNKEVICKMLTEYELI